MYVTTNVIICDQSEATYNPTVLLPYYIYYYFQCINTLYAIGDIPDIFSGRAI